MPADPYLEQRILSADPVELIHILYEHAVKFVGEARRALAVGDIVARSKAISRTIGILGELEGSLDRQAGSAISQNLAALYQYMRNKLTVANLKQEDAPLAEVESLLQTVGSAWKALATPFGESTPALPQTNGVQFVPDAAPAHADHSWTA